MYASHQNTVNYAHTCRTHFVLPKTKNNEFTKHTYKYTYTSKYVFYAQLVTVFFVPSRNFSTLQKLSFVAN